MAGFILGTTQPSLFYSAVAVLLLPLFFALYCFLVNRDDTERAPLPVFTAEQRYAIMVLQPFIRERRQQAVAIDTLRQELLAHGWEQQVVDAAIAEVTREKK